MDSEKRIACTVIDVTARSLVLQTEDPEADYETREYDIYLDGERLTSTDRTVFSVYGLKPDTAYELRVGRDGQLSETVRVCTKHEFVTLDVRDFGAVGDGAADDTRCIQAAILSCPENSRVLISSGVFRFTNLFLKSNMTLEIAGDAVLKAIPDKTILPVLPGRIESWDEKSEFLPGTWEGDPQDAYASLLTGMYVENVVICGQGVLDGSAGFDNWWDAEKRRGDPARPRMIFLNHCSNVVVEGITVKDSPAWNLHPYFSNHLKFYDLKIISPQNSHNTDGIDPESCQDVEIAGVFFSVGDDCVAVKSGKIYMGKTYKTPSRDILIRNCLMEKGHGGVTVGSENAGGVRDILVRRCHFRNTDRGLRVKTRRGRGKDSFLDGIEFDSVLMEGVASPFVINSFYYCGPDGKSQYVSAKEPLPVDDRTPRVGRVTIRNVRAVDCHAAGVYFYGLPESKIGEVRMENVSVSFARNAKNGRPAMMEGCEPMRYKGIFIRNAKKVVMENVTVSGHEGEAMDCENVDELIGHPSETGGCV